MSVFVVGVNNIGKISGGHGAMAATDRAVEHWNRTRNLMWVALAIWLIFGYIIHFFAGPLNSIVIFGFPLGFYMAAQGSLIVFVALIFWFAHRQNQIDEDAGMAEDA
jgi:putative solute:sodium symporter small subunit